MVQPDYDSDIQEFIEWVDKNCLPGLVDPNNDTPTNFLPDHLLHAYLTADNCRRLKMLLGAIFAGDDEIPSYEEIARNYSKSFCILLLIGKAKYILHFVEHSSLIDAHLPFSTEPPPYKFPTDTEDNCFLERFCERQWIFCAPRLEICNKKTWEDNRILPIIRKEILDTGGSAKVFKIELQPEYNRLISSRSANSTHERSTNTFVLKTYCGKDARTSYDKEVAAFCRLTKAEGIIGFYGSWKQNGRYNILLEYADVGTLETFLLHTDPPDKDSDIIDLWESVFQLLQGLLKIHHEAVPNGGQNSFRGENNRHIWSISYSTTRIQGRSNWYRDRWHQDVKPKNILATSFGGEIASPYRYRFKLGDLGLSHFKTQDFSSQEVSDHDSQGTRTYGAPECHRSDDFLRRSALQVKPSVDIWSLGAIYSEVAVWLVRSYKAVQKYRLARRVATQGTAAAEDGDCFHDGNIVLPLIRETHDDLKSKIRGCDFITAKVLDMVQDMLMSATARPDVKYFWERSQRIIEDARRMCDEKTLPRTTNINSRRSRKPPPSIVSESSSASSIDGMTGNVQQYRPPMMTREYVAEPESMDASAKNHISLPSTPRAGHQFQPTTRTNVHPASHFFSDPQVPTRSRTAHQERAQRHRSYQITSPTHRLSPHIIQADNLGLINDPYAGRQRTSLPALPRQDRGLNEDPIDVTDNVGRYTSKTQLPRTSTVERWKSTSPRQASSHPNVLENDDHIPFANSPKQMETQTPKTESESPIPYDSTGQAMNSTAQDRSISQYQNAAKPTANNDNRGLGLNVNTSGNIQPALVLTLGDALIWRCRKKANQNPTLEGSWLLNRVQKRDHIFLIDDSWSMLEYWDKVTDIFSILAYIVKESDPDGVDLYFTMSSPGEHHNHRKTSRLEKVVRNRKPRGKSDIRVMLDSILNDYTGKLGNQKARRTGLARFAPLEKDLRPLNLYVLTDGVWQERCDAIPPIRRLVDRLVELSLDERQIGIQFISFGNDPTGLDRLGFLDSGLNLGLDIVDTTPSTGNIWKMVLGAIDKNYDEAP
ncbi:hypothetical protein ACMFMG_008416 [Clarireedia jacksonii]